MFPEDLIESAQTDTRHARFDLDIEESPAFRRLWLHVLLFIATLFSTTLVGARMMYEFKHPHAVLEITGDTFTQVIRSVIHLIVEVFSTGLRSPAAFASGLPFSLTLLTILMAHEMGHYLACLWYNVDATLPFFIPSPVPGTGTFGAFIRIRSSIPTKRALFDIGVAGPLAGFAFLVPALLVGLAYSRILPGIGNQGTWQLGVPPLQWLAQKLVFPGVRSVDIYLHPMARAAWVGMLATAINLLPAGQLDGGHLVYSIFGRAHKWVTWAFIAALIPMGYFFWYGWLLWAVLLFFFARRHPPVYDAAEIGRGRIQIGWIALVVFVLCFTLSPVNN